jgi:hypothetical protein
LQPFSPVEEVTMQRPKRMFQVAAIALAGVGMTGIAVAQEPSSGKSAQTTPTKVIGELAHTSATVQKVDKQKRELSLKDEQGSEFIVHVPEDVQRFDAIKKGDRIDVDYYESVAMSLKKPGEAAAAPSETQFSERAAGTRPGGVVGHQISAPVEVTKVDRAANTVKIKGPDGEVDTVKVSDPQLQADMKRLKPGDKIQATYSEAVAVSVTPKEQQKQKEK